MLVCECEVVLECECEVVLEIRDECWKFKVVLEIYETNVVNARCAANTRVCECVVKCPNQRVAN